MLYCGREDSKRAREGSKRRRDDKVIKPQVTILVSDPAGVDISNNSRVESQHRPRNITSDVTQELYIKPICYTQPGYTHNVLDNIGPQQTLKSNERVATVIPQTMTEIGGFQHVVQPFQHHNIISGVHQQRTAVAEPTSGITYSYPFCYPTTAFQPQALKTGCGGFDTIQNRHISYQPIYPNTDEYVVPSMNIKTHQATKLIDVRPKYSSMHLGDPPVRRLVADGKTCGGGDIIYNGIMQSEQASKMSAFSPSVLPYAEPVSQTKTLTSLSFGTPEAPIQQSVIRHPVTTPPRHHKPDTNVQRGAAPPSTLRIDLPDTLIRHRTKPNESENLNIRRFIDDLQRTTKGEEAIDIGSLIQTKEEEIRLLFESRDREIERLGQQLHLQQKLNKALNKTVTDGPHCASCEHCTLGEGMKVLEKQLKERDDDIQDLLCELEEKTEILNDLADEDRHVQLEGVEKRFSKSRQVSNVREQLKEVQDEYRQLQGLIAQKDKQLAALNSVDPAMNDSSALQLGVQAISMVNSTIEYKHKIRFLEQELAAINGNYEEAKELAEENYIQLSEKRREAACLVETLASRDVRVARLDTLLQHKEKELKSVKNDTRLKLHTEHAKSVKLTAELKIAAGQNDKMRKELSSRDETILHLQDEDVRNQTQAKDLQNILAATQRELVDCQSQIQKLVRQTIAKNKYVLEMEKRLKKNDIKRHAIYLKEVANNRRLQLDNHLREQDCRHALTAKEDVIKSLRGELYSSSNQISAVKTLLLNSISGQKKDSTGHHEKRQPTRKAISQNLGQLLTRFVSSDVESSRRKQDDSLSEYSENEITSSIEARDGLTANTWASLINGPDGSVLDVLNCYYTPVENDKLDAGIAKLLHEPQYKHLAAVICRFSAGCYLLGDEKVYMRLNNGAIEARHSKSPSTEWTTFSEYIDGPRPTHRNPSMIEA